jgi:hypothetical protein
MGFKNYLLFRVKTYGLGFVGLILAGSGLLAIAQDNVVVGSVMLLLGAISVLYVRYQWREHDIELEQRKVGRRR